MSSEIRDKVNDLSMIKATKMFQKGDTDLPWPISNGSSMMKIENWLWFHRGKSLMILTRTFSVTWSRRNMTGVNPRDIKKWT